MKKVMRIGVRFVLLAAVAGLIGVGLYALRSAGYISKDLSMILSAITGAIIGNVFTWIVLIPELES